MKPTHDSGESQRLVRIGDYEHAVVEAMFDIVECHDFFVFSGVANQDLVAFYFVEIKRMHRVPDIEHNVIGYIDDVVDRTQAGLFEPVFEPFWRRADFDVVNNSCPVTWAVCDILDFNTDVIFDAVFAIFIAERVAMQWQIEDCRKFASYAKMREGVTAVWRNADVENNFVEAQGLDNVFANRSILVKNVEPAVIFAEPELFFAAHHAE